MILSHGRVGSLFLKYFKLGKRVKQAGRENRPRENATFLDAARATKSFNAIEAKAKGRTAPDLMN